MSPSESRTTSSAHPTSTLPTGGGTGSDEDSDPLADLPDLVSSSFNSGEDGRMCGTKIQPDPSDNSNLLQRRRT